MESQANTLFISHVEKEGPFLKVWGQTNKATAVYIEQVLHSFAIQFDNGLCIPSPETLQLGILCCTKYKDNKYYRARITSLNYLHNRYIEVNFIDYGHQDVVPITNIRSLEGFESSFISIPPQAQSFLLAEAVCPRGEWNDLYLEEISKEIRYSEVQYTVIGQVTKHYLIRLFVGSNDLAILLISRGLMRHTSVTTQEAVLLSMMPRQVVTQPQPAMQQNIATYKAFTLEPGSQYEVYVSYVTDGPCNFSVQLKQSEDVLGKLMKEINSMNLTPLDGLPLPGTVCLARCIEDGHICRAVVTNEVDGQFKVFYVDFGNFEVVPLDVLYEIPFKYVIPKVMAIRFALAGIEKSTVTLEMQCAFKEFVDNRLIRMKVMPMTARTALPRCELWDPETQISALDIVNQAAAIAYPAHISLNRGFSQPIRVSYVFSCNRFFVQLNSKREELTRLMTEIQIICKDSDGISLDQIKVGLPCYALFETDYQWYRSQIVEVLDRAQVRVQYVDYGNEEVVAPTMLRPIEGKQLTVLRPQAIECCLNGYQNMDLDSERDGLLEELILEQDFTMKVVEMQGKKALVELIDSANYNVASLLLDKIATTRSQVSPMLVQAGNKIEHRKSSVYGPPKEPFNKERRPERTKTVETEENSENTMWRQNNQGFNKNYDGNRRDNDFNNSNESDRPNNKSFNRHDRNRNDFEPRNGDGDSYKQTTKTFNKNRDRPPRDNRDNRNNDWGDGDSNKKSFNSRARESSFSPKGDDDWNDASNDKKSFNARDKDERKPFKGRETNDWGGDHKKKFNNSGDDWGDNSEAKRGKSEWNKDGDDWGGNSEAKRGKSEWNKDDRKGFSPRERDNFKKPRDRNNTEGDSWGNDDSTSFKTGGFRKKTDFKREGSEISSSGSETGPRKGFRDRDNSRSNNYNKKFDKPKNSFSSNNDNWNTNSTPSEVEVEDPAPNSAQFITMSLEQTESTITISWFHNPGHFYCLLENKQDDFKQLMEDIQQSYKDKKKLNTAVVGAPVIGLFPEDNVLYRGQILEVVGSQYKILYVDFGNVSVIDKIWPIEKRFMDLPAQAICCKLHNIDPPSESWPEASNYADYFNKPRFACQFFGQEEDKFCVKIQHNGEDIGDKLVSAGLAVVRAPPPPVELMLLAGQQFRAMLLSINSLADFALCLQNGTVLTCSVFNLENSSETFENNLKDCLEQILIVYVDDVVDDRLHVTLYDANGSIIKLIDKDEHAFETVELICPYLILYSVLSGVVTHVEESVIYLQPVDCSQNVDYLLNALFECYDNMTLENPIVPVEGFVYAVRGSDSNWYRGRVTSFDEKSVLINFLDYGNSENVEMTELRELSLEFMEVPMLCVAINVTVLTENFLGTSISVAVRISETGIEGVIDEQTPAPVLEVEGQEELQPTSELPQQETPQATHGIQVILSHADSPSDFYLHLHDSLNAIENLQATLQEEAPSMTDLDNPAVGALCAAPYSADQQWYRAQVLDADSDITTVRFVDYGNTDVLDNKSTRVKTLSPSLLALEVHATRCRLKIKPVDEEWTAEASERFEELCNVDSLTMEFINQDEKINYVELFSNGHNVREILIQEKFAVADEEISQEVKSSGFVSHLNSPSEFWIQLENCVDELEWVAEQLSGAENFTELEDLAPGTLCAALFPDDQMWYRARILSNTVAGIEVLFVDYGNSCTSCSLRELPEDLVMLSPLAQKCSLQKPSGLTNWGPEMIRKFNEISADGQTTFEVKKLSTGETALVDLLLNGENVTKMLLPETEDVTVKNVESLDALTIVKGGQELEQKYKLENLADTVWNEESVKKFLEINEDGSVFQAEFVSEDTVRLYLGVNDIRLDLSGTKTTTPTSSPLKSRSEIHSNVTEITDKSITEIAEIVNSLVDKSVDIESDSVVKPVVEELIEESVKKAANVESVSPVVEELIEELVNKAADAETPEEIDVNAEEVVQEIVNDAINERLNEADVAEILEDIVEESQSVNVFETDIPSANESSEAPISEETSQNVDKDGDVPNAESANKNPETDEDLKETSKSEDTSQNIEDDVHKAETTTKSPETFESEDTCQNIDENGDVTKAESAIKSSEAGENLKEASKSEESSQKVHEEASDPKICDKDDLESGGSKPESAVSGKVISDDKNESASPNSSC